MHLADMERQESLTKSIWQGRKTILFDIFVPAGVLFLNTFK